MLRAFLLGAVLALSGNAYAADSAISALPAATSVASTDLFACAQGATTRKCTGAQVQEFAISHPGYVTGFFYIGYNVMPSTSGPVAVTANDIKCYPSGVIKKLTTTNAGIRLTTASAGGNIQGAMYTSVNGRPGDLVAASASMSTTSVGSVTAAWTAAKQIGPGGANADGNLWKCSNADNAVAIAVSVETIGGNTPSVIGASTMSGLLTVGNATSYVSCAGANCTGGSSTFGTWPASLAGSTWSNGSTRHAVIIGFDVTSQP